MTAHNQIRAEHGSDLSAATLVEKPQPTYTRNGLTKIISGIDRADADVRCDIEVEDNKIPSIQGSSTSSIDDTSGRKVISWEDGDLQNPYNWSSAKKSWVVFIGMLVVVNSTMGSSLPSNAIPYISEYFHIRSSFAQILPISMYLIGYIVGPVMFGPLSEVYGRRLIMTSSFVVFTIFTMACALAPNWGSLLIFRLLTGVNASSPIACIGGVYADMYGDPVTRGRAMAVFIGGTCVGPLVAPLLSGYVSPGMGWRWTFWIGLIVAGATLPPLLCLPETYGPILLAKRAAKLRKSANNPNIFAPIELEKKGWKQMATVTLTRPLRMIAFELIVLATCLYLSLAYGIFYMYFEAYPIIFEGIYGQSSGESGLMFLPIGGGTVAAIALFLWYDSYLRKAQLQGKAWTQKEESRRLPLACIGGPLYVVALFWLGWTARPSIPFYVPMLAGLPFGMGFILIFMALLNYLTDAYEIFAASAMAAASCCRSVAGAVLPFAATPMYRNLGVPWATSLLAFLSLGMCIIPFGFLWKGDRIRAGSKFCIYLKEKKENELAELERRRRETGVIEGAGSDKTADEKV
ncbi:major facilitator superfamily domain-containing protein [Tricladium varicosporioides]|nr:major facilitator superfamily domain-containing protein [Hymenoscyphus varicosporioides]